MKIPLHKSNLAPAASRVHELFEKFQKQRNPLACFDAFYAESAGDIGKIPWARQQPNPGLVEWEGAKQAHRNGWPGRALVIGCGLGDDAEYLARQGWTTHAFDLSRHAIDWARRRFPGSQVNYFQADLFQLPGAFHRAFDLVFESSTVQAIPVALREKSIRAISDTVARGGKLLAVARARDEDAPLERMPWPLARSEIALFEKYGLREATVADEWISHPSGPVRVFKAEFFRPRQ